MSAEYANTGGDNYDTADIPLFWSSSNNPINAWSVVAGIPGMIGNCLQVPALVTPNVLFYNLASVQIRNHLFVYRASALLVGGYTGIFGIMHSGNVQLIIANAPNGAISVWLGSTSPFAPNTAFCGSAKLCESSPGVISSTTTCTISVTSKIATGATGYVTVQVNGQTVCSALNVVTSIDGAALQDGFGLFGIGYSLSTFTSWFRGIMTSIPSGIYNTGIIPPLNLVWVPPTGAGRITNMSNHGGATNWQSTGNSTPEPDGDTTYVSAAAANTADTYAITPPANIASIAAVFRVDVPRTDDGGAATIAPGFGNGTTEAYGSSIATPGSYIGQVTPFDTNPLTTNPWQTTDLSTLQLAEKRTA